MVNVNGFQKTVDILHRTMDAQMLRYNITANNLSNAEVPNFKRTVVSFESDLKRALDSEKSADGWFEQRVSSPRFKGQVIDYKTVKPRRSLDYLSEVKPNGNNVDAEEEAMNVLKVQMQYRLLAQMVGFEFAQVQSVLK